MDRKLDPIDQRRRPVNLRTIHAVNAVSATPATQPVSDELATVQGEAALLAQLDALGQAGSHQAGAGQPEPAPDAAAADAASAVKAEPPLAQSGPLGTQLNAYA